MTAASVLERAQRALQYQFSDQTILSDALTHASVASTRQESNERLEFLGDAILGMVVCEELYRRFANHMEGDMTKIKSVVVSRRVCAEVADGLELGELLFLGKGMRERDDLPLSLKAAVFESLIAAIYLDGGIEPARAFILDQVSAHIDEAADSENQQNFKSHLQQYAQQHLSATPQYEALDEQGPDHSKCFEVCVTVASKQFPSAWGNSKKEAEQRAALRALQALGQAEHDEDPSQPADQASAGN